MTPKGADICGSCQESVTQRQKGIQCNFCDKWHHCKCQKVPDDVYNILKSKESCHVVWYCAPCKVNIHGTIKRVSQLEKTIETQALQIKDMQASIDKLTAALNNRDSHQPQPPTFAAVVSNNNQNVASLSRELKREHDDHLSRERNVIIYGTQASEDGDKELMHSIAGDIGVSLDGVKLTTQRIGKVHESGAQLLRVTLAKDKKRELLDNAKRLNSSTDYKQVFIRPDLTKAERQIQFELRKKLREIRESEPGKKWKIWRGKVIEIEEQEQRRD